MISQSLVEKQRDGMVSLQATCKHQSGLFYILPSEMSWVCDKENLASHAMAGFHRELAELKDPRVVELMRRWGIYFRNLPLEEGGPERD